LTRSSTSVTYQGACNPRIAVYSLELSFIQDTVHLPSAELRAPLGRYTRPCEDRSDSSGYPHKFPKRL
jgi:hypothetical protein